MLVFYKTQSVRIHTVGSKPCQAIQSLGLNKPTVASGHNFHYLTITLLKLWNHKSKLKCKPYIRTKISSKLTLMCALVKAGRHPHTVNESNLYEHRQRLGSAGPAVLENPHPRCSGHQQPTQGPRPRCPPSALSGSTTALPDLMDLMPLGTTCSPAFAHSTFSIQTFLAAINRLKQGCYILCYFKSANERENPKTETQEWREGRSNRV